MLQTPEASSGSKLTIPNWKTRPTWLLQKHQKHPQDQSWPFQMKDQADVVVADETPKATSRPKEAIHSPNEINFAINAAKFQEHW